MFDFVPLIFRVSPLLVVQLWKPKESLWRSWIWIADPDGGESALPGGHAVGVVVSIGAFGGSVRYHWPWVAVKVRTREFGILVSIAFPKSNAAVSMCCVLLFVWKMSKLEQIVLSVQTMHKTRQYGMNRWIEFNQRKCYTDGCFLCLCAKMRFW